MIHRSARTPAAALVLVCAVQVLVMATWFSASAVVPAIRSEWDVSAGAATWLTAMVQLGFVTGAVASAVLNLPDRIPVHLLMAGAASVAAGTTALIALTADGLATALPLRFVTGVALAGVYPPGLKVMATWFARGRGLALGIVVGALTLGSALPQLVAGSASLPWRSVLLVSAGLAAAGAVVAAAAVRPGPLGTASPPFNPRFALVLVRERAPRLATIGYLGHMWELYAMWTWLPAFVAASYAQSSPPGWAPDPRTVAFLAIGIAGAAGCVAGGWWGDRFGRARLAAAAMAISGSCCLAAALLYGTHPALLLPLVAVWGAAVIADSGLFSTCISESVDPRYVGTALTTQLALGFLLTVLTIRAVPVLVDAGGWRLAVALLGVGPLVGMIAMARLQPLLDARPARG